MKKPMIPLFILLLYSCSLAEKEPSIENWKNEIIAAEAAFAKMAASEGIPEAFLAFAAEDAVLMRNNKLIIGKEAMRDSFAGQKQGNKVSLSWKPDFVDVSASGDLGYTYGKYLYTTTDSTGNSTSTEGVFHTVWKRQADGTWKFVWD